MTKTEVERFRAILTARVAELERVTRQRDAITVKPASQRALAVCNLDGEFKQLRDACAAFRRIQEGLTGLLEYVGL
jgi:hypothetical protein